MLSLFSWLRESIKNAILGGVVDAIDELNRRPAAAFPEAVEGYRERLALPAPDEAQRRTKAAAR